MEKFVGAPIKVPFGHLHLDPNNPRLGQEEFPGYEDASLLCDKKTEKELEALLSSVYDVDKLVEAIVGQGWTPIDNIVTWMHPDSDKCHVVVEGNTRTLALRRIRTTVYPREKQRLERMERGGKTFAAHDVEAQRQLIKHLERIIADTDELVVVPLAAKSVKELEHKLPRVLAVRHITGAKEWTNFAADIWLLQRYHHLFEDKFPGEPLRWDEELIKHVAAEASLSAAAARKQLQASSAYSHFRAQFEDRLPEGEGFESGDYYLFENLTKKPFLRDQFGLSKDALHLDEEGEEALFTWVFKEVRPRTADENTNVFYRHENVLLWDQIHRYDEKHGTSFASRFDVSDPKSAPTMFEVEAEYIAHKARRKPQALLDDLLRRLSDIPAEMIINEGEFLRAQLARLKDQSTKLLKLIDAAAA